MRILTIGGPFSPDPRQARFSSRLALIGQPIAVRNAAACLRVKRSSSAPDGREDGSVIVQLDPSIPVDVLRGTGEASWPAGKGYALAWIDYSQEHFTLWKIVMDATGEIWDVPQSDVRVQRNVSMVR